MTANIPGPRPGPGEAGIGPRGGLDPLLEAELVVDDGAANLGLGVLPRQHEAGPAPNEDDEAGQGSDAR
ncbi:hypothetical protein [Paeniglutamicibacter sp. NPDC091659]|uniref:hypothetical protein n=1 Tax=Paeniglutamicibacter sp. NPDC091659 TaxID=3364389 RepID=UPI003829AD66